jgi:hypothetical protein
MNNWNTDLIETIFSQKQREKSEDRDNLLRLISRSLYGETIHYALELIQNAEDEKSSIITFIFDKAMAVVINDGRSFDEDDVWRICSVRTGMKKKKIGFFGIGFKAVFNITATPQVISGNFNFELYDFIYPKAVKSVPDVAEKQFSSERGSVFALPYCPELASPQTLIENFSLIDEKLLLFLDDLQKLSFVDRINGPEWTIYKDPEASSIFLVDGLEAKYFAVSLVNTLTGATRWKVFHLDLPVKDKNIVPEGKEGIENTRITIAFPLDNEVRDRIKKSGVVYCYLPTKKRTDLPFLVQADFLPTVGRENISEHQWNTWLMEELGVLAGHAIDRIKEDEPLVKALYDFIPLADEIQDEVIGHLYRTLFKTLKQKEIAKADGKWLQPEDCLIPNNDRLRAILTETDLRLLFGESVSYIDASLSDKDDFTRAEKVLFELGARRIKENEVIAFLQKQDGSIKKTDDWFLDLYDYLRIVFDTTRKSYRSDFPWDWDEETKSLFKKLELAKFILTDDRKIVSLEEPGIQDRLICYPQNIDLHEIHQLFTEGEIIFLNRYFQESGIARRKEESEELEEKRKRVKEWFDSIGVKKYFRQVHIIKEVILPKFTTRKYQKYGNHEVYNLLNYIRAYWSTIESEIQNKKLSSDIVEEIMDSVRLKAYAHAEDKLLSEYRKPGDIY